MSLRRFTKLCVWSRGACKSLQKARGLLLSELQGGGSLDHVMRSFEQDRHDEIGHGLVLQCSRSSDQLLGAFVQPHIDTLVLSVVAEKIHRGSESLVGRLTQPSAAYGDCPHILYVDLTHTAGFSIQRVASTQLRPALRSSTADPALAFDPLSAGRQSDECSSP